MFEVAPLFVTSDEGYVS